jgi:hypothetical protein
MQTNPVAACFCGLGILIFAGISGFGYLLIFFRQLRFSQHIHKSTTFMI